MPRKGRLRQFSYNARANPSYESIMNLRPIATVCAAVIPMTLSLACQAVGFSARTDGEVVTVSGLLDGWRDGSALWDAVRGKQVLILKGANAESLESAVKLGEIIRKAKLTTVIDGDCNEFCLPLFLGGAQRQWGQRAGTAPSVMVLANRPPAANVTPTLTTFNPGLYAFYHEQLPALPFALLNHYMGSRSSIDGLRFEQPSAASPEGFAGACRNVREPAECAQRPDLLPQRIGLVTTPTPYALPPEALPAPAPVAVAPAPVVATSVVSQPSPPATVGAATAQPTARSFVGESIGQPNTPAATNRPAPVSTTTVRQPPPPPAEVPAPAVVTAQASAPAPRVEPTPAPAVSRVDPVQAKTTGMNEPRVKLSTVLTARNVNRLEGALGIAGRFGQEGRIFVYASFSWPVDQQGGTHAFETRWYRGNDLVHRSSRESLNWTSTPGSASYSVRAADFGVGRYRVEVWLDDQLAGSKEFAISAE